jgi:feruloyl-CoA synthase
MPELSRSTSADIAPSTAGAFDAAAVDCEHRADGTMVLRSPRSLDRHPHSVLAWLEHWAAQRPQSTLLAQRDARGEWRTLGYAQALAAVRSIATALRRVGASQYRPLAILSENSIEQALITWGAQYAGVPVAPISPAYALARGELARLRGVSALVKPWVVFAQERARFARAIEAIGVPAARVVTVDQPVEGGVRFADWLDTPPDADVDAAHATLDPTLPAKYMFTSGSTGVPKAVVITHGMLAAAQQQSAQMVVGEPADPMVQVDWLPWHHVMGGNVVLNRVLRFGGTLYLDEGKPLPGRFEHTLANLREVAPTYYFNVPAGYAMLVEEFERDPAFARHMLSRLEFAYFAGASLPRDIHDRFQQAALRAVGKRIAIGTAYAATETTAAVMMRTWAADDTSCIGLPVPGCELKLIPDTTLPGRYELRARGPNVSGRYLDAPDLTAAAFDDEGFYRLGDAVRFVDPQRPAAGLLFAGRFAEDFKLGNGSWVRTGALRTQLLNACAPLLREAVIVGEGRDSVGALAWPDVAACRALSGVPHNIDDAALMRHSAVLAELSRRLGAANEGQTASTSRVERFALQTEPPSMDGYELTDKGSINRRAVTERRAASVAELYTEPAPGHIVQSLDRAR